jgi:serine/threonine-protein kinase RsbW
MGESPKIKLVIPSKLTELPTVQQAIIEPARKHGFGKDEIFAIRLALDEAVSNAIHHGNANDPDRRIIIEYQIDDQAVRIDITDEGCGFCRDTLPDPTREENLATPHGRGVMLIEAYMTEVRFNNCGNCISMVKRKGCKLPVRD